MRTSFLPCCSQAMHSCEAYLCLHRSICILRFLHGSTFRPGEKWREQPSAPTPCFATRGYRLSMHALTALVGLGPPLRGAQKVVGPPRTPVAFFSFVRNRIAASVAGACVCCEASSVAFCALRDAHGFDFVWLYCVWLLFEELGRRQLTKPSPPGEGAPKGRMRSSP